MTARMTPLLSARAITKQFGGRNGCRNVTFDLYPGEVLCIVGESGSGKTTIAEKIAEQCPEACVFRFDSIGVPSPEKRIPGWGSGGGLAACHDH